MSCLVSHAFFRSWGVLGRRTTPVETSVKRTRLVTLSTLFGFADFGAWEVEHAVKGATCLRAGEALF